MSFTLKLLHLVNDRGCCRSLVRLFCGAYETIILRYSYGAFLPYLFNNTQHSSVVPDAMKTVSLIPFLVLLVGAVGCKKTDSDQTQKIISSCTAPPSPVMFVLLNKQGNSLVTTSADQVVLSYSDNGQTRTIPCVIGPLQDAATRQPTAKYGGLLIGCSIGDYSVRQTNPIKTFQVTVNNQGAGTIYYDLQPNTDRTPTGVQDCFKLLSFQFNTVPVQIDQTVMPFAAVLNSNL